MKILHLTSLFPYSKQHLSIGAGGHAVFHLINNLQNLMGADSHYVSFYYPILAPYYGYVSKNKQANNDLGKLIWFPNLTYKRMLGLPTGLFTGIINPFWQQHTNINYTENIKYDIIHLHASPTLGILAARLKDASNKPLVVTVRREFHKRSWQNMHPAGKQSASTAIRAADAIASPSALNVKVINDMYGKHTSIIPNGTDDLFDCFDSHILRDPKSILFVGTLDENKNILLLVRVFKKILQEEPDAKLKIAGTGPLQGAVEKEISGHDNIKYFGRISQEQVRTEMRTSSILCVPSDTETFGIVYAEGMKQGMAVIGRSGTGIDGHGIRGKHYELIDNDSDLPGVLLGLLSNKKRCIQLGKEGRQLALTWNWDACAKSYMVLYDEVTAHKDNSIKHKNIS